MLVVLNGPNIAADESLSDVLDVSQGLIVKLTAPHEWNGDRISFQTSSDGVGFNDLFYSDGDEVVYRIHAGTGIIIPRLHLGFMKIRSGTRDQPVKQTGLRTFAVALDVASAESPPPLDELGAALKQLRTALDNRYLVEPQ